MCQSCSSCSCVGLSCVACDSQVHRSNQMFLRRCVPLPGVRRNQTSLSCWQLCYCASQQPQRYTASCNPLSIRLCWYWHMYAYAQGHITFACMHRCVQVPFCYMYAYAQGHFGTCNYIVPLCICLSKLLLHSVCMRLLRAAWGCLLYNQSRQKQYHCFSAVMLPVNATCLPYWRSALQHCRSAHLEKLLHCFQLWRA